jgi:hypothetical protein
MTLKIAVAAPMPSASVTMVTAEKPGARRKLRIAKRRSWRSASMACRAPTGLVDLPRPRPMAAACYRCNPARIRGRCRPQQAVSAAIRYRPPAGCRRTTRATRRRLITERTRETAPLSLAKQLQCPATAMAT